jgi:hypothetical protein
MTQDALESRREQLTELEKSEREARRLEEALGRGRGLSQSAPAGPQGDEDEGEGPEQEQEQQQEEHTPAPASAYLPPHPGPSPSRRRVPGMGLLNALSYTIHGMMDADPETARRNGISKTRETISQVRAQAHGYLLTLTSGMDMQLEDGMHLAAQDLKYASSTIQADLDRFQRQKVADLREMTIAMATTHRDWCKKVCAVLASSVANADAARRTWKHGRRPSVRLRRSRIIRIAFHRPCRKRPPRRRPPRARRSGATQQQLLTDDER